MENISSFFLDQRNNNKLLIPKYIFIAFLFFNKISLHLCISLDIKVLPFSEIYNLPLNQINNLRNLSPKIQNIFGSMFKLNYYYTNLYIGDLKEKQGIIIDQLKMLTTLTNRMCKEIGAPNEMIVTRDVSKVGGEDYSADEFADAIITLINSIQDSICDFDIKLQEINDSIKG